MSALFSSGNISSLDSWAIYRLNGLKNHHQSDQPCNVIVGPSLIITWNILLQRCWYIEYWDDLCQNMLQHAQEKLRDTSIVLVYSCLPVPTCCLKSACAKPHMSGEILDYQGVCLYLVVCWQPSSGDVMLECWYFEVSEVWHAMEAVGCICPVHVWSETTDPCIA